jgi:hypothetical protein
MLTTMTEEDWLLSCKYLTHRAQGVATKGRDDKKLLSALHYFVVHK